MDSEGIVKAWARKVTTKTAMATVPATDWIVAGQSPVKIFSLHHMVNSASNSEPAAGLAVSRDVPTTVSPLPAQHASLSPPGPVPRIALRALGILPRQ